MKLTDREVELLLSNLDIKSFTSRDEQEVAGHADAMETGDLLKYSTKDERHRGEYKTLPNDVAAFDADGKNLGVVFETTPPFSAPGQMAALIAWTEGLAEKLVARARHRYPSGANPARPRRAGFFVGRLWAFSA